MEDPSLGVELELPAYTTATATQDPSRVYKLCCSLRQHRILNPLSRARDRTSILRDTSWVPNPAEPQREFPPSLIVKILF